MKRKNFLVIALLLLLAGSGYLLSRWLTDSPPRTPAMESREIVHGTTAQPSDQDSEQKSNSQDPWLVSQNKRVEAIIEKFRESGVQLTSKEKDDLQATIAAEYKKIRAAGGKIPVLNPDEITLTTTRKFTKSKQHEGPQTVEAIMATFDAMQTQNPRQDTEVDLKYPRAAWIQRCLDLGVVFKDFSDYSGMLAIRGEAISYEKNPNSPLNEDMKEHYYGLPPDASLEEYTNAAIKMTARDLEAMRQAELEDPTVSGGFGTRNGFIPMREGVLYVKVDEENFGASFYGDSLSEDEEYTLLFDGIAPEGLEVIYLGEDDQPLPAGIKPKFDWANFNISDQDWEQIIQDISDEEWQNIADIWKEVSGTEGRETVPNPFDSDASPMTNNRNSQPLSTNEKKSLKANSEQITTFFEKLETEHGELQLPAELKILKRWHKVYQRQQKEANQPPRTNQPLRTKAMESEIKPKVPIPVQK